MNQERPDETIAKQIVEQVMGIQLEHADTHGGVDYKSSAGDVALEVTTVTEGARKGTREALSKSEALGSTTELQACWIVHAMDTQPRMKNFVQQVQQAIAELEFAGETRFDREDAAAHMVEKGDLSHIYQPLLQAGVERAIHFPHPDRPEDPDHIHRIHTVTGSGGSVSGSDESLDRLVKALDKKTDNPAKLRASGAEQRHLFVWLDDDTSFSIGRPLAHGFPNWADEGWGLPTTAPKLDPAITHFWVVHNRSGLGWLWDGEKWQELRDLPLT
ncbi:hypothetical protein ASH00_15720 [Arthrobacter sp. Soil782]|uniref:hypothetical protein n=1 Tax=Arthrobacter sp. Soil782 TaxID=1736410 RepID=UPI0007015F23|nr:hypothetical protein [Arthrobacter sp. Soil782]KRF03232.1 hypothetical protein ASH00_15720 [Arthrobacter sp. Soil782]